MLVGGGNQSSVHYLAGYLWAQALGNSEGRSEERISSLLQYAFPVYSSRGAEKLGDFSTDSPTQWELGVGSGLSRSSDTASAQHAQC